MLTRDVLLEPIDQTASIIEIGPSYNPLAPKAEGWNTKTIDVAPKSQLIEKYRDHQGVDLACIEDVDFIWQDGPVHAAVPPALHGTFEVFIASHVIEHSPDFIDFLDSATRLLTASGMVILAIPDKRYCFDFFRPLTTTGDILFAHHLQRSRHSKKTIFDFYGYVVFADNSLAWGRRSINDLVFAHSLEHAYSNFLKLGEDNSSPYTDFHAWIFTPSNFQLILLELARLKLTDWRVDRIGAAVGCEFFCWLRRGGVAAAAALTELELNARRIELLKHTLLETKEQIQFLTDGSVP